MKKLAKWQFLALVILYYIICNNTYTVFITKTATNNYNYKSYVISYTNHCSIMFCIAGFINLMHAN